MTEAERKKNGSFEEYLTCPNCHTKVKPDAEKCTQCGLFLKEDKENISDFINEGGPD
jgi:predicted amidophosphoribosyltransferase